MSKFLSGIFSAACVFFSFYADITYGQSPVNICDTSKQQIFRYNEMDYLEDNTGNLTFNQVKSDAFANKFRANADPTPRT